MRLVGGIPYVTAEEMKELDREAIESYGINVLSLMENAGAAVASAARAFLGDDLRRKRVACLTGKGNNGGDGLVAVRHLYNWGAEVSLVLPTAKTDLGDIATVQLRSLEAMGVRVLGQEAELEGHDLLVDALLGYNSKGDPREPVAGLIGRANDSRVPILAVDIPSGLDPTTGEPGRHCVTARETLTLGLPKTGFLNPRSRPYSGSVLLGDVSLPRGLYARLGRTAPIFDRGAVVKLH